MAKRKKRDLGFCAYCTEPATTQDHVPPKGMFAKSMPDKPWVPSCERHNADASKNDQYMQRLAMLWGADACADARDVEERFMRSLDYPEAKGLAAEVRRSLSPLEDESLFPGGIAIALSGERLGIVVDKLVRGWMFKLTGNRLPENYDIMKFMAGERRVTDNPLYAANEKVMESWEEEIVYGDRAFVFKCAFGGHDPYLSAWRFEFYKVFKMTAFTCRMEEEKFQILDLRSPPEA